MRNYARVVVIGGGNMGASVLYHLAREGWTDCVLVEKAELTSGATWHAAGLVSRMVAGHALGTIHDYGVDFYKTIEAETEQSVSFHGCGSLRVATSPAHLDWIRHVRDAVRARGQIAEIIDPDELVRLNPLYDVKAAGVLAALHTPDDGHVDPAGACFALARGARQMGAEIVRHCRVVDVGRLPSGEWEVRTEQGSIRCEHVVNAGGYHARQIGAFSGLDLPITTMQHHYVITDEVPEFAAMDREIPVTRDDYFSGYVRREQGSALIGLYDKQDPQAVWLEGCPWDSENELFEPNLDGILPWLERCFERCPALVPRGIKKIVNGGITYTPDGAMLLGPAPGLQNYWLACGATVGIAWGPGAGRALAQWMVHGTAEISMRAFDPRRFGIWADADYARARATEDYTLRQAMPFPQLQRVACRDIKRSGAHARTAALGALYEEAGGWERPRLYAPEEPAGWRRTGAFETVNQEARAVRERVGLGDFSAFAKFEITGPEAATFLERVCANRMPRRIGSTCLTAILNGCGTIEGEATIARLGEERYWLVTGAPSERRVWDWLTVHQRGAEEVTLVNRTDETGILTLAGPHARDVLGQVTDADLSNDGFPWLRAREILVAGVETLALRMSFTGELAWELHAPNETLGVMWDALWSAGQPFGIAAFGSKAIDSLRMEKAYRGGHELANDVSPVELDMMRLVKLDKSFVGRNALARRMESGRAFSIAYLEIDVDDADVLGGEPVYWNGSKAGSISSGAYGPNVGKSLAFAFLAPGAAQPGTRLEVSILDTMRPALVLPEAALDPRNERLKS
ncbi:FAD-dependent oxidoreductase [Geminicoccaceae bacterium 1502E]|nr:FAD-dependent oxidoreductase [Geminicoccaceae bacterium 1502E]